MTDILIFTPLLGFVAGFLSGLLGIGGGIIIIPSLLYLLPNLAQVNEQNVAIIAIATSLFTICITAFSSARSHLMSAQMWRGKNDVAQSDLPVHHGKLAFGGIITGGLAALAGLGGGAILVPYLTTIGVAIRQAIAAAAIAGVLVASFGSIGYLVAGWQWTDSPQFFGYIHWPTALMIMLVSYFSAPLGVKAGQRLEQAQLKKVFAIFMLIVAIKLILEVTQVW